MPPFARPCNRLPVPGASRRASEMGRYPGLHLGGRPDGPTPGALKKRDRRPAWCGRHTVANKEDTLAIRYLLVAACRSPNLWRVPGRLTGRCDRPEAWMRDP